MLRVGRRDRGCVPVPATLPEGEDALYANRAEVSGAPRRSAAPGNRVCPGVPDRNRSRRSGGVLPGVTVEASSPALIEKVRSAVTDGTGQYRIVDLRPGTYSLTFTLPGFSTVKRDGIELTGSQTLTIPVEMRVGGLEETITVTGESPVVDVQTARREIVIRTSHSDDSGRARRRRAAQRHARHQRRQQRRWRLSPTMTFFNARSSTINSTSVAGEGRYDGQRLYRCGRAQRRLLVVRLRHAQRRRSRHHRRRRPR